MYNSNIKLVVKLTAPNKNLALFTLYKGAQLDASIITPTQLIKMHAGTYEAPEIDERAQSQVLKSVMGECLQDITGMCSIGEAVNLIRALSHKQEVELITLPSH